MSQIEDGIISHASVKGPLRRTPVMLRVPGHQIVHRLNRAATAWVEDITKPNEWGPDEVRSIATIGEKRERFLERWNALRPNRGPLPINAWGEGRDHETLMTLLEGGYVPVGGGGEDANTASRPPSVAEALRVARSRGYTVPDHFLDWKESSYSEVSAWSAAQEYVRHRIMFATGPAVGGRRQGVLQLAGSHVIPDPLQPNKVPYVADQLWIVAKSHSEIRLLVLEIDGEPHLDPERARKDAQRDVMLGAMGYEVFHAAGWWARIDPYRVVFEFLRSAGLMPHGVTLFGEPLLHTIDDYVCGLCGNPMTRYDEDWIEEVWWGGRDVAAHSECVLEAYESGADVDKSSRMRGWKGE